MLPIEPGQPGYGMFNIGQIPTTQFNIPAPKPKGGMFGGGKVLSAIAEALAAYSAGMGNPGGMAVLQGMNHRRMQKQQGEQDEQQYHRRRLDGIDDYRVKQQIDAEYSPPPQPTELERLIQAAGIAPGSDEYASFAKKMLDVKTNPMVMTPYGPMPYSAVSGGGQQQSLPQTLSDNDFAPQGGPSPLGSGGFPRPF
jgi:hypothetical protein